MKIMIDTNILISAFVFGGRIRHLVELLSVKQCEIYITKYIDTEFKRKLNDKFPEKRETAIIAYTQMNFTIYPSTDEVLGTLRDKKDIPVLSDAIYHNVDILLSGDKDFLESGIRRPKIISPTALFEYLQQRQ